MSVKNNVPPRVSAAQIRRLREYYRRKGCSPNVVARDMVTAVREDVDVLLTGPAVRLVYHLRRVSLRLARFAMLRLAWQSGYLE